MGNSLLLRDEAGRMTGYVQLCAGTLRCRVTAGAAERMELLVGYVDGGAQTCDFAVDGGEQTWPAASGALRGACVLSGGRVLCATDDAARAAGRKALLDRQPRKPRDTQEPPKAHNEQEKGARAVRKPSEEVLLPQRRWPPPPCLAGARYDGGAWIIRGEEGTQADAVPDRGAP